MATCNDLIVLRGQIPRKITTEDYATFAEIAGVKFIRLRHIRGFGTHEVGVRGFQGVEIIIAANTKSGQLKYTPRYSVDEDGEDTSAQRTLYFEPDRRTNELVTLCPDTPYNRRKLAAAMIREPFCEILDDRIKNEVKKLSREIEAALPTGPSDEEVMKRTLTENEKLKEELYIINKKLEDSQAYSERKQDIHRKLEREKIESNPVKEDTVSQVPKNMEALVSDEAIRDRIRVKVCEEKKDLIDELKLKYNDRWDKSKEYQKKILPEINDRFEKTLANIS
jgi:hypothetical protein